LLSRPSLFQKNLQKIVFFIFLVGSCSGYAQEKVRMVYGKPKLSTPQKKPIIVNVPAPLLSSRFIAPNEQFLQIYETYARQSYLETLRQSRPAKDSSVYTYAIHKVAMQAAIDYAKSYDFDVAQYVSYKDWDGRSYLITLYHSYSKDMAALEYLDSISTRHTLIVNRQAGQIILMSIDKSHQFELKVMEMTKDEEIPSALFSKSFVENELKNATKDKAFIGLSASRLILKENKFNHGEVFFHEDDREYTHSVFAILKNWLPTQTVHLAKALDSRKILILRYEHTYGDKPSNSARWKTFKVAKKPITIELRDQKNY
jgi:hypothetical protein